MIDFHKELKKFKPCLEVEKISEKDINSDEIQDLVDILRTMNKEQQGGR